MGGTSLSSGPRPDVPHGPHDPADPAADLWHRQAQALLGFLHLHFTRRAPGMPIELNREARAQAVASIERYFAEELDQRIGNIAAAALLGFFLEELGPLVYNQAVRQAQERLQERVQELDIELHEDEFRYWQRQGTPRGGRR